jgi:hypothetical protein
MALRLGSEEVDSYANGGGGVCHGCDTGGAAHHPDLCTAQSQSFLHPGRKNRTWIILAVPYALHQCSTAHAMPSSETAMLHAPTANFTTVGPSSMFDGFSGTNKNSAILEPGYWRPLSWKASCTRASKVTTVIESASRVNDKIPMAMGRGVNFESRRGMIRAYLVSGWTGRACLWLQ